MAHINYQALRGKVHAYAPAEPPSNPHLWVILDAGGQKWFATINVRSNKDAPGEPIGKSYLYYYIDTDFSHPILPSILARPDGMSAVERTYAGGAIDFQRGNLFNPNAMRVLPPEGPGDDGLVHRLGGLLQFAQLQSCDVFFYGNAFAKDNPNQTDAAFGYTPDTPLGLDNVHMAQGDPREVNVRLHENGIWHDGACFIWDAHSRRMTAIFLAFQSQGWHTNANGDLLFGATGCEAPLYDFSNGAATPLPPLQARRRDHFGPSPARRDRLGQCRQHGRRRTRHDRLAAPRRRANQLPRPGHDARARPGHDNPPARGRAQRRRRADNAAKRVEPQGGRRGLSRRRPCQGVEHELRLRRPAAHTPLAHNGSLRLSRCDSASRSSSLRVQKASITLSQAPTSVRGRGSR